MPTAEEFPPLPDDIITNPLAGRLDIRAWFPHPERRLEIEIGSGKGTFLVQQASLTPETNYLGIEWAREFALYTADRVRRNRLPNVRVLNTDAAEFLHWRVPDAVAAVVHLYFPDPWPKTRHHRRRIVQQRFLHDVHRVLTPGGELRVVTDHDGYWEWMQREFAAVTTGDAPLFQLLPFERPNSAREGELVGTNFERKYRREGRPFHAAVLRKPN